MKNGAIGPIPRAQAILNVFDFRKEGVARNTSTPGIPLNQGGQLLCNTETNFLTPSGDLRDGEPDFF
jgi:hypothetical protein